MYRLRFESKITGHVVVLENHESQTEAQQRANAWNAAQTDVIVTVIETNKKPEPKKNFIVRGAETGYFGAYATKKEAIRAIKNVVEFDLKEMGETDKFWIEEEK